jgi:antitoxin HicB
MAEDCLAVALGMYVNDHEDLPVPSPLAEGQVLIAVPIITAAKLSLYNAMRMQSISNANLAKRLGVTEDAVGKLVNLRYRSHISQLERALRAVGRSLIIEDQDTPQAGHHASTPEIPKTVSPRSS